MEKAKIFEPGKEQHTYYVQFNPNTLEYAAHSNSARRKHVYEPNSNMAGSAQGDPTGYSDGSTLSVRLFFHTYRSESDYTDVRNEIRKIRKFLRSTGNDKTENDPKVTFAWGTLCHTGTMDSMSVTYQMFAADGTPVQAEANITISGEDPDFAHQEAVAAARTEKRSEKANEKELPLELDWLFE